MEEEDEEVDYSEKTACWFITYSYNYNSSKTRKCFKCSSVGNTVLVAHNNYRCSSRSCKVLQTSVLGAVHFWDTYCVNCFEEYYDSQYPEGILKEIDRRIFNIKLEGIKSREDLLLLGCGGPGEYTISDVKVTRKLPTYRNSKRARE